MNSASNVIAFPGAAIGAVALSESVALPVDAYAVAVAAETPSAVELPASAVIERAALTKAVAIVKLAVESRHTIPILTNAMLHAVDGALAIIGTDLDMQIRVIVPASIDKDFRFTGPADMLDAFVKKATACDLVAFSTHPGALQERKVPNGADGETELYTESGTVTVEFDAVKYRLNCLPCADFPDMKGDGFTHEFAMPGKALWDMVDGTMAAISKEETRYYLNGIYFHVLQSGNRHDLIAVATDGHRLYRQSIEAADGALGMPGVILPQKLLATFHKLTKGKACPATVAVSVRDNRVRLAWDNVEILSKVIDGTFPDYQRVIPASDGCPMTFDRDEMAAALQSVALISSERGRAVKLVVDSSGARLMVNNPETGSAVANVALAGWATGEFEIGVNARYLENALDTLGAGECTVIFGAEFKSSAEESSPDNGSPMRLSGSRGDWDAVLMPMRV